MRVTFWGVRGSVPWATPQSIGHGCNTPCIELQARNGERLVLDGGSGILGLGRTLAGTDGPIPVLLTHYHWDHVQGLPFFGPLHHARSAVTLWAPFLEGYDPSWIAKIFEPPFFPVPFDRLAARPKLEAVRPGRLRVGGFDVRALPLNHPGGAFAYRVRGTDGDLVYASDHETGVATVDEALREFAAGARAVIFDAHFKPEEAAAHRGWGHSTWEDAARLCRAANVERLWLFHHKPGRADEELDRIEDNARAVFAATDAASEGLSFEV